MTEPLVLTSPEVQADPYPHYAELRRRGICQVDPFDLWAISRHSDVISAFKNPDLSSTGWKSMLEPEWLGYNPLAHAMAMHDPPEHTRLRKLVSHAFTATALERMSGWIRATANDLANKVLAQREVEFVNEFALKLPAHVMGHMLGLPEHLYPQLKQWSDDLAGVPAVFSEEEMTRVKGSLADMEKTLNEIIADRRRNPGDDMISDLIRVQENDQRLTDAELMSFGFVLVAAGLETTISLLAHSLHELSRRPELLARITANRGQLIPAFIDEMARYEPPVHIAFRLALRDTKVGDVTIPANAMTVLLIGSATHDERQFERPEELILGRENIQTAPAFGHGIHYCLGAMLGKLEARLGLEALLFNSKGVRPAGEAATLGFGFNGRNLTQLPLAFDPK